MKRNTKKILKKFGILATIIATIIGASFFSNFNDKKIVDTEIEYTTNQSVVVDDIIEEQIIGAGEHATGGSVTMMGMSF